MAIAPRDVLLEDPPLVLSQEERLSLLGKRKHDGVEEDCVVICKADAIDPKKVRTILASDSKLFFENGKFTKHEIIVPWPITVELICPSTDRDVDKYRKQEVEILEESPEVYATCVLPVIEQTLPESTTWVVDIVEGRKERENVLFQDESWVLVKDYKWKDEAKVEDLHLLAIAKDASLRSLRDLRGTEHADSLASIQKAALDLIASRYGVAAGQVRRYFHYHPTFWHLHIHFDHLDAPSQAVATHGMDRAHPLQNVIANLRQQPNFYADALLTLRLARKRDAKILELAAAHAKSDGSA
eukprot:gnl/TRDRNA2_/TRDRNA2_165729_c0_seq2.p1 gnl/TRDRNA2_/TRDRNA2_165729_c0~~gnl/TRDRNA2_/TRDRNA2_165729_c0_seq2.p1  ORF type:complete len:299 (+),score=55.92 gnl/TRDRNA2_/TRDRNA2_165729_c0_seq2:83-979(+)